MTTMSTGRLRGRIPHKRSASHVVIGHEGGAGVTFLVAFITNPVSGTRKGPLVSVSGRTGTSARLGHTKPSYAARGRSCCYFLKTFCDGVVRVSLPARLQFAQLVRFLSHFTMLPCSSNKTRPPSRYSSYMCTVDHSLQIHQG